jgi:hypothetical protein
LPFFWIPAFAGMTIIQLISDRYHRRHTREGGYPVFKTTFYDSIKFDLSQIHHTIHLGTQIALNLSANFIKSRNVIFFFRINDAHEKDDGI